MVMDEVTVRSLSASLKTPIDRKRETVARIDRVSRQSSVVSRQPSGDRDVE